MYTNVHDIILLVIHFIEKFFAFANLDYFRKEKKITVYLLSILGISNIYLEEVSFVAAIIIALHEFQKEFRIHFFS